MKRRKFLVVAFSALSTLVMPAATLFLWEYFGATIAESSPPKELKSQEKYETLNYSGISAKEILRKSIQDMMDQAYDLGFRTVGHADDWFHGHFLFEKSSGKLKALYYHTQERAGLYQFYEPKSKFSYVNKNKRNWIQMLDTMNLEDANTYRYGFTKPQWCASEEAYTIDFSMLDPVKLGFEPDLSGRNYQFNFYQTRCDGSEENPLSRKVKILNQENKKICLQFYDSVPRELYYSANFYKYGKRMAEDRVKGKIKSQCPDSQSTMNAAADEHQ